MVYEAVAEEVTKFWSLSAQKRKEVGRTEAVPVDSEMWFHNSVELNYAFEDTQALYFQVFQQKDGEQRVDSPRQLWGEQWISVGQVRLITKVGKLF